MLNTIKLIKLNRLFYSEIALKTLKETLDSIKDEIDNEEMMDTEGSAVFGHSLSKIQMESLDFAISIKRTLSLGKYLNKLAQEKRLPPVNDATFGEANITKSYWSRLINDTLPTHEKNKLIRIAIFLKLNLKETLTLLNKAGYTLSEENIRDRYIIFFIEDKIYDLADLEEILLEKKMRSLYTNSR